MWRGKGWQKVLTFLLFPLDFSYFLYMIYGSSLKLFRKQTSIQKLTEVGYAQSSSTSQIVSPTLQSSKWFFINIVVYFLISLLVNLKLFMQTMCTQY